MSPVPAYARLSPGEAPPVAMRRVPVSSLADGRNDSPHQAACGRLTRKRQSKTVLTIWLTEILRGVFRRSARPSRVAHLVRAADGLIGPARGFAR